MQWTAVCFTLLVACLGAAYSNRCVENLYNDVLQCFSDQDLNFLVETGQQDASMLMKEAQAIDPEVQCQQIDKYKDAIGCALQSLRRCLSTTGMGGALPNIDKFRQGMDALCEKYEEFDYNCLKNNYYDILTCGQNTMADVVQKSKETERVLSVNDIICISADINYDCTKLHLSSCGNSTLFIYLEQLDKYQVPEACMDRSPGRSRRISYISNGAPSSTITFHTFPAVLVSTATLILFRWSGQL